LIFMANIITSEDLQAKPLHKPEEPSPAKDGENKIPGTIEYLQVLTPGGTTFLPLRDLPSYTAAIYPEDRPMTPVFITALHQGHTGEQHLVNNHLGAFLQPGSPAPRPCSPKMKMYFPVRPQASPPSELFKIPFMTELTCSNLHTVW
jgi:hypothetical protein